MKIVNATCTFIFMFVGMVSFASEKADQSQLEVNNLTYNKTHVSSASKIENNDNIIMVNVILNQISSYKPTKDSPTINEPLANLLYVAAGFALQNYTANKSLSTIINEAMTIPHVPAFKFINSIEHTAAIFDVAMHSGETVKNTDRIIIYNAENKHSKQLKNTLLFNAKNYEGINAIDDILDYTFVNENFDYYKFIDLINKIESKTISSFSLIISENKSAPCIAFFGKNNQGTMRCMSINANDNAKNLVKKLIPFFTDSTKGRLAVARFITALYNPPVAIQKLEALKLQENALYEMLNSKNIDEEIQKHLRLTDENTGLINKNKQLTETITELNEKIVKLDNKSTQLEQDKKDLNNTITKLQSINTEAKLSFWTMVLQSIMTFKGVCSIGLLLKILHAFVNKVVLGKGRWYILF